MSHNDNEEKSLEQHDQMEVIGDGMDDSSKDIMTSEDGDINLVCRDCGDNFIFSTGEQEFYRAKSFEGFPTRCKPCRAQKKVTRDSQQYDGMSPFGGQMNYMMIDAYGHPFGMFPFQQSPPSNLRTKPCHAFQRGECNYGPECRFYHDDGSQGPPGQYLHPHSMGGYPGGFPPQVGGVVYMGDPSVGGGGMFVPPTSPQQSGGGGNFSPRNNNGHRNNKSRNPCFAYQRGECTYGDTCRYQHVDASAMTDANGKPIVLHPSLPRGYCHAFVRGECKYGDTCKFRHEIPSNLARNSD